MQDEKGGIEQSPAEGTIATPVDSDLPGCKYVGDGPEDGGCEWSYESRYGTVCCGVVLKEQPPRM